MQSGEKVTVGREVRVQIEVGIEEGVEAPKRGDRGGQKRYHYR